MDTTKLGSALLAPDIFRPGTSRWLSLPVRLLGPGSTILAATLFLLTLQRMHEFPNLYDNLAPLFALIVGSLVILARHRPVLAFVAAVTFGTLVQSAGGMGIGVAIPLLLCGTTAFGFARLHGWTLTVALFVTTMVLPAGLRSIYGIQDSAPTKLAWAVVLAVVAIVDAFLLWRTYHAQGRQLAEVRQRARKERGQRRYLEERNRIAREMHDVVAHHMSMVAVKASTAEYRFGDVEGSVREEFRSIADTARESLSEMRRVLSVFRPNDRSAEREPQPGVDQIERLCQGAEAAGVDVTATVSPDLPAIPDAVSLTAYRVVQEALSNVIRHAPGAPVTVEVFGEHECLVVLVTNGAATRAVSPALDSGGLGLVGMRERVELLGGELSAGPAGSSEPSGWSELSGSSGRSGFRVRARLPLERVQESGIRRPGIQEPGDRLADRMVTAGPE